MAVLRFAGFELDQRRAELRGSDGEPIRLRPKPFAMLHVFASNAGRVVSKQELMEAVWPNVHVGEDSLFQCIREIRTALGDEERRLIKVVSGRGYLFEAEVAGEVADIVRTAEAGIATTEDGGEDGARIGPVGQATGKRTLPFRARWGVTMGAAAGLCAVIGLAVAAPILAPNLIFKSKPPAIAVKPILDADRDPQGASMAASVTDRLADGLAGIDNIRIVAPRSENAPPSPAEGSARATGADYVIDGTLQRGTNAWTLEARMTDTATGEVKWTGSLSVGTDNSEIPLQQSRLAAGIGHELAIRINALLYPDVKADGESAASRAKVVVQQAIASINQTTRERFAASQTMLESALAGAPDNVDLQVALAALQTRGIQMVWYGPDASGAAETSARSLLERALQARPNYIPGLEAYCRFLTATNNFVESLVACARVLSFDPWNGSALYQMGLTQIQLGRFEDALATFKQADRFDTPVVSRWTWLLGIGWANLLLGNDEEAVPWLERSIAITPASGRPHMMLAVAYYRLGRLDDAKAALAKGMELRPGSTALNIAPPTRNASPVFVEAGKQIGRLLVEIGLPAS